MKYNSAKIWNCSLLFIVLSWGCCFDTFGQNSFPKEGDFIADYKFRDVVNFPKNSLSISDFLGKWVILDMWTRGCAGCIASWPKINNIAYRFRDRVQVIMVGIYRHGERNTSARALIHQTFETRRKKYALTFPVAYDSNIANVMQPVAVPSIFIIDPAGRIRAKTTSIDSAQLADFIAGKSPEYEYSYSKGEHRKSMYNPKLPLLTTAKPANGGLDTSFITRSLLVKWNNTMPYFDYYGFSTKRFGNSNTRMAEAIGFDLASLLRIAYTGNPGWTTNSYYYRYYQDIIIDTDILDIPFEGSEKDGELYAYSVSIPANIATDERIRDRLRLDLESSFGFRSYVEPRDVAAMKLVVIDEKKLKKLKTKGQKKELERIGKFDGFNAYNFSLDDLVKQGVFQDGLTSRYNFKFEKLPIFVNSTNINFNIDLEFRCDMLDFDAVRIQLRNFGLDFIQGTIKMNAIVIKAMR